MFSNSMIHRALRAALVALAVVAAQPLSAHVDWSRVNGPDPDLIALYHFNETSATVGQLLYTDGVTTRHLVIAAPVPTTATAATISSSVPELPIFGPSSLQLNSTQTLQTTESIPATDNVWGGDLTIEFWYKWNADHTASSFTVGNGSGAKVRIDRDVNNPAADILRIDATHGDFRSVPGFTNWPAVGVEESALDEWRHVGLTIKSTGRWYDPVVAHDRYSTGTVARLYLNGHATGTFPHTIDLTGLQHHDFGRPQVRMLGGSGVTVDEVTMWKKDWSNDGAISNPFANGRPAPASVEGWSRYE